MRKKRHHFVPVTYLQHFSGEDGKIFTLQNDPPNKILHTRPSEIAFEKYYYAQRAPNGELDTNLIEDAFSDEESKYRSLVAKIKNFDKSDQALGGLCTFIGMMRIRVPALRDMIESSAKIPLRKILDGKIRRGDLPTVPESLIPHLHRIGIAIDPQRSLTSMPVMLNRFALILGSLHYRVIEIPEEFCFITTDNPVCYFEKNRRLCSIKPYHFGSDVRNIRLLFPLSSHCIVDARAGFHSISYERLGDERKISAINLILAKFSYRLVFSARESLLASARSFSRISPIANEKAIGPRISDGRPGSFSFVDDWVFGARPSKTKWDGAR